MRHLLSTCAAGWALAGGVLLLVIVAVTSWNVGSFVLATLGLPTEGLPGYEDAVRLLISVAALSFFPYCQDQRGHVAVDLFVSGLPASVRARLDQIWLAATAVMAVFLGYMMIVGLAETRADQTSSSILGWPEWPFYAPGVISMALWAAIACVQSLDAGQKAPHGT